jgi:hypothetical protein
VAELTPREREKLKKRDFAYVDREGEGHLPIHDAEHVRNAVARWNQTHFQSASAKEEARKKILRAAEKHRIEVSSDDKIRQGRG